MERKAYKPGLYDSQISAAKVRRNIVNHKKAVGDGMASLLSRIQHERMAYTEQGDFTNCFRRGI